MIRILGIAPYEGMRELMTVLASGRDDLVLAAYTADYTDALDIAEREEFSGYDAIISRGGIVDILREHFTIPVIAIEFSQYDILQAINLAKSTGKTFAIVGFPRTVKTADLLCRLLQYDIPVFTTNSRKDVEDLIPQLRAQGISMVIGDHMISVSARNGGLDSILITSSSESISAAIDEAVRTAQYSHELHSSNNFYHTALKLNKRSWIIYDKAAHVVFSDIPSALRSDVRTITGKMLPAVLNSGRIDKYRHIHQKSLHITGDIINSGKDEFIAFEITPAAAGNSKTLPGITMNPSSESDDRRLGLPDAGHNINRSDAVMRIFYSPTSTARKEIDKFCHAGNVLIAGESGLESDVIAEYIHSKGKFSKSDICVIDCEDLSDRTFEYLTESSDSPLYMKDLVLYFKRFELLSEDKRKKLIRLANDSKCFYGKQLVLSVVTGPHNNSVENTECIKSVLNGTGCALLSIPPLCARVHEIPAFAAMYLNELAAIGHKQIVGIEPEGMTFLQSYSWPDNIRQFIRVIKTLFDIADEPYIHTDSVLEVLSAEKSIHRQKSGTVQNIDINRTLDEIITDVIAEILKQDGMNRTKAARQLGICRTTLWKYIHSRSDGN